ncbi:MAG: MATE family efflux transporter [Rhizobiales bacterium 62-47]|nr:MATE family efflux transporter [Hyphomicrobiales bacterium]OJY10991.1 MAG: MATE family efflux transporter [Rhizobiales bacterium 62-47]
MWTATMNAPANITTGSVATNQLLTAPILPTLLRLALPNTIAMLGSALVAVAETAYIGRLGIVPLAAIALAFPFTMLMQMTSAGAMGGSVSSAISRALGAGDRSRAATLAWHAAMIGVIGGIVFTLAMWLFGRSFFAWLGGRGAVLEEACAYADVLFAGAISIWLVNTLASIVRGTGDMRVPSATLLTVALLQVVIGGTLGLGLGGVPQFGMRGVAAGQAIAYTLGTAFLIWYLMNGRSRLDLQTSKFAIQRDMFFDILRVGAIASFSPLQTVLTILVFTSIVASFGTEALAGYGIGARLEFLLIPIAFAFGIASTPMVGMAIGAGLVSRARRVAWTTGAAAALTVGLLGVIVAIKPTLWISLFTTDPGVSAAASSYFAWAGPAFGFFGLGVALYFSAQGAARVGGPVLASTLRLLMVGIGGWWLAAMHAPAWALFALVGAAMVAFGLGTAAAVCFTRWGT